jgi:serine/threonine protein phosphatase PrpC
MSYTVTMGQHIGGRSRQEDSMDVAEIDGTHVLALADGVGGQAFGDVASACAVQNAIRYAEELVSDINWHDITPEMVRLIHDYYITISSCVKATGGAATLTTAFISTATNAVLVTNIGDSSAYHIRPKGRGKNKSFHPLRALTARHGYANILTQCMGWGTPHPHIELFTPAWGKGDGVLLTSDGCDVLMGSPSGLRGLYTDRDVGVFTQQCVDALGINKHRADNASAILITRS